MQDIKNVLILFNNNFYKETDIDSYECNELIISNDTDADIPLNININSKISLKLIKNGEYWEIIQGENVYLVINDIKVQSKKLLHGDQINIKLSNNRLELFKINFFIDFSSGKENYDKIAEFSDNSKITFGSDASNNICITDNLVDKFHCYVKRNGSSYSIVDLNSRYSVYINGKNIDNTSKLNVNDFIIICGYKFLFMGDRLLLNNYSNTIIISGLKLSTNEIAKSSLQYPEFIRNPRFIYNVPEEEIEIIAPPHKDKKPSYETFLTIIPTVGMMMLAVSINKGSNPIYYVGMVGVTFISTALLFIIKSRKVKKSIEDRKNNYLGYLTKQKEKIQHLFSEQQRISKILYPTINESIEKVKNFNHRMWEKEIINDDFLSISLGEGTVAISFKVKVPKEEWGETEDELILKPREIQEEYQEIENMPITINLSKEDGVALIGERRFLNRFIKNLIVQIVSFHYYEDVKLALICDEEEKDEWDWMRWLPHVWSEDKKVRFLGEGKEAAHNVMTILSSYLESRKENKDNKEKKVKPYFIILVTNPELLEKEKLASFLEMKNGIGYTPIFLYEHFEKVPNSCSVKVDLKSSNEGELVHFCKAEEVTKFKYNITDMNDYEEFARRIAPVYVKQSYTDTSLPKSITLFELYNVNSSREIPIAKNWGRNEVYKHIAAPLGIDSSSNLISLDLHEKYHGPHGLVAGTTGSGKSELLQSLIISLAINYHPYDINFILIDYKGGGMANLFRELPHLVGTITNLDGRGINRSLIAIKSELHRRERIFGENNVNHIDQYIKLYKEGKVNEPLPHLIMIADEFAELKRDQPDFMQELVSTARIGRSLGVHLILATQKPAGVVNDQIWSNSKFKLCLKVQDASDSNEVIKSKLAANIVEPGRAYLQVGNNEIFELFQSAWSGAKVYEDDDIRKDDIEISRVSIEGIRDTIYSSKKEDEGKKFTTQLDDLIKTMANIAKKTKVIRLQGPWLPELQSCIFLEDLEEKISLEITNDITCIIGKVDDPVGQKQYPLEINFATKGNILVTGAAGYGKTTILQTMIISLVKRYKPKDVNIYIIDCGTRVLKVFEDLPHVGGVILKDDEEKLNRLISMMKKEIDFRKNLFSSIGVASLSGYKEASGEELPQIIIMIDNYIGLKEMYESLEEDFNYISREGITLGISTVITTNSYSNIRYKMVGNFKEFFSLTCQDSSEYSSMFGNSRTTPADIKGRILLKADRIMEAQICLPVKKEKEFERVNKIKEIINEVKLNTEGKAKEIPYMPDNLYLSDMINTNVYNENVIPLGITYSDIEKIDLNLNDHPTISVLGGDKSGKSNFLKNIITVTNNSKNKLYVFDSKNFGLRTVNSENNIIYVGNGNEEEKYFDEIIAILEDRVNRYNECLRESESKAKEILIEYGRIIIIIDSLKDFVLSTQKTARDKLLQIINKYREMNVNVLLSSDNATFKELLYGEPLLKKLKEEQFGIVFSDIEEQKVFDVYVKYGSKKQELRVGDANLVLKNKFTLLKTYKN